MLLAVREKNDILKQKLDDFIRRYYINRLLKGLLLGAGGLLAAFIMASVAEYYGHFGTVVRAFMFFGLLAFLIFICLAFILIPLLKSRQITQTISYTEASKLLGIHFPEISDKLLNTLQLQEQAKHKQDELLEASILQRLAGFSKFSFDAAVNLRESFGKYARYTVIPLVLLLLLLVFQSNMITRPAKRIIAYKKHFVREAPFRFVLKNKSLNAVRNSDLLLELELKGKKLPSVIYVKLDGKNIRMESSGKHTFSYMLYNLTRDYTLVFTDEEYESEPFHLKVQPDPSVLSFLVKLSYPAYTGKKSETFSNTGDLTVPEGSRAEWAFTTSDADKLSFNLNGQNLPVTGSNNRFSVSSTLKTSAEYYVIPGNSVVAQKDTIRYNIQVVPDRYPAIVAEEKADSLNPYLYYFYGRADDDYGISKLNFVSKNSSGSVHKYQPVEVGHGTDEIFYYMLDLRSVGETGSNLEYYFEVWDNDAVNGKKSSRSQLFRLRLPDRQELRAEAESNSSALKQKISESMQEIRELQKRSRDLNRDLNESKQLDWQQQEKLRNFMDDQKKLEQKLETLRQENLKNNEREKQLDPLDKELLDKQKELEKLFNEVLSPEMKDLLKKLEETLKQQNKDAIRQQLEKMEKSNEDMKKQLDRSLEQFKQFEVEKRIKEEAKALRELAEKQKELARKTADKSESREELQKQQEGISKEFEQLKKEIEKTLEKNNQLENPVSMDELKQDQQDISNSLGESSESLDKKQNKKASEKQKQAGDKMEDMADKIEKSLQQSQEEQQEEDYYALRQLLENLIELSLQQESLLSRMKELNAYSPKYVELSARQRKLKEVSKMVEDSLLALSKRQIQIKSFVNKEIGNINMNMDAAIDHFSRVQISGGVVRQQYVMTGLNNLAVMLSETLKNMQESMKESKDKKQGQCKKPGDKPGGKPGSSGKPKMGGLKQQQDQINKMLQEMKQGKQQGKTPGSEQFAKLAARQEALRREVERLQKLLKEEGMPGAMGDLEKTRQLMEQQERDLVNKQINAETLRRMEEIETRMLEHEKAEREQDQDQQRESEKAREIKKEMPPAIKEYLEKKAREMELLRSVPNELSPYYKDRVRIYFQKLGVQ